MTRYLILNALIAGTRSSSSKMNSPDPVLNVKEPFTTVGAITAAANGVHLHLPTQEISVLNSGGQSQDILGIIFNKLVKSQIAHRARRLRQ